MICGKCKEDKGTDFRQRRTVCRECDNAAAREYRKKQKEAKKPDSITCRVCKEVKMEFRIGRKKCLDCERAHGREYRKTTDKAKTWANNNRERMASLINNWQKKQYENNPKWKQMFTHRRMLVRLIRGQKTSKYVNCNSDRLIDWLKFQFTDEMKIENHNELWVFDHVIPIKSYLDQVHEENIVLNWLNIRPATKKINSQKHKNIDTETCLEHLENVKRYIKIRKLKSDNDYIAALEKVASL